MANKIPVYMVNGFLESGKTEFITFTLGQPYFQIKGRTLLILCEEGENEYDPALLKKSRTDVVLIEEEEEFNPNHQMQALTPVPAPPTARELCLAPNDCKAHWRRPISGQRQAE